MSTLMRPLQLRRLTAGERSLCDEVFLGEVDPEPVRLFSTPAPQVMRPFVPGEVLWSGRYWIVFPAVAALADFTGAGLRDQARLVHELTHIWQAQGGLDLLSAKFKAMRTPGNHYRYELRPDSRWEDFNMEQQAMIVEDAFRLSRGGGPVYPQTCPAETYARVKPFRRAPQG